MRVRVKAEGDDRNDAGNTDNLHRTAANVRFRRLA